MEIHRNNSFEAVALVSTPWPLFSQPSVQIGALKAYLKAAFPDLHVAAHHFYLILANAIGYGRYRTISERTWLAESLYASLLFPERSERIEKVFCREAAGKKELLNVGFGALAGLIKKVSDEFIRKTDWRAFGLVGFSISLCQLTSALYFIKEIKQRFPSLPIVVGGSTIPGASAARFLKLFPQVDFVVRGEGELPLSQLVKHLRHRSDRAALNEIPGLVMRGSTDRAAAEGFQQMPDLKNLPPPDYDDYFRTISSFRSEKQFFATLTVETSRGCWWRVVGSPQKHTGCAFCNLNLQWEGYRTKDPDQIACEIDTLTSRYKTLSVAFADNALPVKGCKETFTRLANLHKDFRFFAEIRATMPKELLCALHSAGLQEVQVGIEALSTNLLAKMNKGTSAIQNLEIMKNCEELGIRNISNLILHFPGSDYQDVEETLRCLGFVLPFQPLRLVHFWLGLGSLVWRDPKSFGIKAVFNHPRFAALFPPEISKSIPFIVQAYRGNLVRQKRLWRPVAEKVRFWQKSYRTLLKDDPHRPILSYRDGRDFLIISQKRLNSDPLNHRLTGTSREIYLFCEKHRSLKKIAEHFPRFGEEKILSFLRMMVDKKLMYEENDNYLSLAIPERHR